jgi:hypothetical protein
MARLFVTGINLNKNELQNARIQNLSTAPSSPVAGQIYFNTSTNVLYFYNGTEWTPTSGSTEVIQDVIGSSVVGGVGLTATYNDSNGETTIDLDNTAVTPGSYGSATQIPTFTVDDQGRLTAAGEESIATTLEFAGNTGGGSIDLLTETLTVTGNNSSGIGVSGSGNTITVAALNATSTQKGTASFDETDFVVSSGHVTLNSESIQDKVAAMVTGNTETGISVTYQDVDGTLDFVVEDQFPSHTTSDLAEGSNLYYTAERVQDEINNTIIGGTGIDSTYNDGTGKLTIDIDSTVATLSGAQTLTNKALGSGTILDSNLDANNKKITNLAAPVDPTDAANKNYVDTVAAEGLHVHEGVDAATTGTLATISGGTVTYDNGTNGVGATLTTTGTFAVIDGVSVQTGARVLVKNETNRAHNGIYIKLSNTELARDPLFDSDEDIEGGDFVFVVEGTQYAGTGWVQSNTVNVIGTDEVIWQQFSGAGTYLADGGLTLTGNTFSVDVQPDSADPSLVIADGALQVKANNAKAIIIDENGVGVNLGTGFAFSSNALTFASGYGVRKYASNIGDGSATSINVTHNFNTKDVTVQVYKNGTPYYQVEADVLHANNNYVTLEFASAPTLDEYRVVITG